MTIIRTFRIVRIFKVVKHLKEIRRMFGAFIGTLTELVNVASLLFLLLFLYAVLGMNLFATVKLQQNLNHNANFQNIGVSLLTLFGISTGENWPLLQADVARERNILFQCQEN